MSNPFGFSSGSSSYSHLVPAAAGGHSGIGGFFENLGGDVRDMAVGIPTGLVEMAAHPIRGIENTAKTVWADWSPLFHGHTGEWAHNFYSHPLGPLLDVASLFTAGAGLAGRGARVIAEAGKAGDATSAISRLAEYSKGGKLTFAKEGAGGVELPTYYKALSKNPLTRLRQETTHDLLNKIAPHLPSYLESHLSYEGRHSALANTDIAGRRAAFMSQVAAFTDAGRKLYGPEALKYQRKVLIHSYNTIKGFAFKHEVAGNTYIAKDGTVMLNLPKDDKGVAYRGVVAEPAKGGLSATPELKAMRTATKGFGKKVADIRGQLLNDHGVKVATQGEARKALTQARHDEAAAIKAFKPSGLFNTRVKMLESYIGHDKMFRTAAVKQARFEERHGKKVDNFFNPSAAGLEADMRNFTQKYLSSKDTSAVPLHSLALTKDGKHALIVPEHQLVRFGIEGSNSAKLVKALYTKPTTIWKHLLLGYRPAYFVNNAVGNHLMYMMAHDPISMVRGYRDALRQVHTERAVSKSMGKAEHAVFNSHDFQDVHFKDQMTNSLADATLSRTMGKASRGKFDGMVRQGFFGITHNIADRMVRKATLNNVVRELPEFQKALRAELRSRKLGWDVKTETGKSGHASVLGGQERPWLRVQRGGGRSLVRFTELHGARETAKFRAGLKANPRAWNFTHHTDEELAKNRVLLSSDGHTGFMLTPEGDLQNVFNNKAGRRGAGHDAVDLALHLGAKTLDHYDGHLTDFYKSHGFRETSRSPFDPQWAPPKWDYANDGRPDFVEQAHPGLDAGGSHVSHEVFNAAAHRLFKADHNGELRRYVSGRVSDVAGDYHSYNALERGIKQVVPFYAWDRHLARHMKQLTNERPWKADALARIGQQGQKSNQNLLGDVPQFLKGALPLSLLGLNASHPSRTAILGTQGLNPYATIPDAADAVGSLLGHSSTGGGGSIGAELNPLVNSAVQVLTGRSTLTGAPIHSSVPSVLRPYTDLVGNLPQWKVLKSLMEGAPMPKPNKRTGKVSPFLFEKSFEQYLSQFLGVPVEQMSAEAAASMAKRQRSGR